jgi:drug/metabolite transporter (DMT)-like permease
LRERTAAALAAAGSSGLVGISIVLTKSVSSQIDPVTLTLLRYTVGAVFLLPAVLRHRWRGLPASNLLFIAVLGTLQFGVVTISLNWALKFVSAGEVALLFSLMPALTLVIGWQSRGELLSPWKIVGVVLCFGAIGLLLGVMGIQPGLRGDSWLGYLAVLGGTLTAAVCAVLYRPLLGKTAVLPLGGMAMLSASVVLLPLVLVLNPTATLSLSESVWWVVLALGACSAASYGLWLWALMHASPTRVTVFVGLSPVAALVLSSVWFGQQIAVALIVPLAIMIFGLWVTHLDVPPATRIAG